MVKDEVILLAQLVASLRALVTQLDDSIQKREVERVLKLKKEALDLQKKIDALL